MSTDFQLAFSCPHLALEERSFLATDRQTLYLNRPIASTGLVQVTANNVSIPSSGLNAPAFLLSSRKAPFKIDSSNVLTVQTLQGTKTVILPTGRISVQSVSDALGTDLVRVSDSKGNLLLEDVNATGKYSRILVSGSASYALGFVEGRGAVGKTVYPSWQILPQDLDSGKVRGIRFDSPIRSNPVINASYTMFPNECSRCQGSLVENDVHFDGYGNPMMVEGSNLLVQASQKILLTVLGSNPYHKWYGSSISGSIGQKAIGTQFALQESAREALTRFQNLQAQQAKYQRVSPEETLYTIDSIRAYPSQFNLTAYTLDITVRNASNKPVSVTIVYTAPGIVAQSSNGLSLGAL